MAMQVAELFQSVIGPDTSVRVTGYDGSAVGPPDSPFGMRVRTPRALAYLASSPGSLGLARAYVTGDLEIDGEMSAVLRELADVTLHSIPKEQRVKLVRSLLGVRLRNRAPIPDVEYRPHGRLHSKRRDAGVIAHHYDVSNRFYSWVLGPSMAYTCAVYPTDHATLEEAQRTKHELVARKLGLEPGMRLLDVGCGWGGMVRYAARNGVKATGVTLSANQADWAQRAIAEEGLADLAEVRHSDYRDVGQTNFDAVSSIGLTEHIGVANYPAYFGFLLSKLRAGGLLLNHCITRHDNKHTTDAGGFIDRYVFPDGELTGSGRIITAMQNTGFEVVHEENLRHHYAMTLRDWCANLVAHWDEAVDEVGLATAKVWGLYMAGSRVGFEHNAIQLHQVLGVKLDERGGDCGLPLRPWWRP
jgi:cyclopropane-fatty-acyl-phospholipid synthase